MSSQKKQGEKVILVDHCLIFREENPFPCDGLDFFFAKGPKNLKIEHEVKANAHLMGVENFYSHTSPTSQYEIVSELHFSYCGCGVCGGTDGGT